MATGNMLLGMSRKKLGDIVFYRSDGQQRARVRVRVIKNPRSAKQAVQRMVLATASKTLAALRGLYNHSFESVAVGTPSLRHAQQLLMEGYRGKAAAGISGAGANGNQAEFAIKGAPIAGCYNGMPLTKGRLTFPEISMDDEEDDRFLMLPLTSAFAAISTQEQYVAELAKMGIEPGDQLTFVCYARAAGTIVAEFDTIDNYADIYRYARVTFKTELPENFSGSIVDGKGGFNTAVVESTEGVLPTINVDGTSLHIFFNQLPKGYAMIAGTIVRSKKNVAGVTYYNNASFVTSNDLWDYNEALNVYPSYMDTEEAINVGDTLYLKNAEAAPFA